MQRIQDPTRETCPSYDGQDYAVVRAALIAHHAGPEALTNKAAIEMLQALWKETHGNRVQLWEAQVLADQAQEQEQIRREQEDEEQQQSNKEKEQEERRKESDRKKPKINPFDMNQGIGDFVVPLPAAFAIGKLDRLEYIELDYFTPKGCKEAQAESQLNSNPDTYGLTHVDKVVAFQAILALKPSKNIRSDEELNWEETVMAKNSMIHFMSKSKLWPVAHIACLAEFYVLLETHPLQYQSEFGNKIIITYASTARREWIEAMKREEGFNLTLINPTLMASIAETVKDAARKEEIAQIRIAANTPTTTGSAHRSSRKCLQCYLPSQERESRSPLPSHRHRESPRKKAKQPSPRKPSGDLSFQSGTVSHPPGVCAVCLGCFKHNFSRCNAPLLWDGQKGAASKNNNGRLANSKGLILCFDWQLPNGCTSSSHKEKHICSGCGKGDHGAQMCPRRQKN
ncbi:hypothetical protein B0H34DRAFT_246454 [Crassisporium funariophilum]|nr:hypothetical protein B0H34DRAFT_246454 [Crassisporium funariophilum]